jgi:hypothetical protein
MGEEGLVGCIRADVVCCAIEASLSSRRQIWPANTTGPLPDSVIMLASINCMRFRSEMNCECVFSSLTVGRSLIAGRSVDDNIIGLVCTSAAASSAIGRSWSS